MTYNDWYAIKPNQTKLELYSPQGVDMAGLRSPDLRVNKREVGTL